MSYETISGQTLTPKVQSINMLESSRPGSQVTFYTKFKEAGRDKELPNE